MKTMNFKSVCVLICFLFSNFTAFAGTPDDALYARAMEKALVMLDSAQNADDLLQCRNQFERIAQKFSNAWQPVYYTAYCDVQMVYFNPKSEKNSAQLEDAKAQLEKLEGYNGVDLSEVSTLWGYYYNAYMVVDPASSQKNFNLVISSYEKAIGQNPENPRPIILRAFFNQFLPPFVKLKIDMPQEVEKAKELFGKEERAIDKPYWGAYFLDKVKL